MGPILKHPLFASFTTTPSKEMHDTSQLEGSLKKEQVTTPSSPQENVVKCKHQDEHVPKKSVQWMDVMRQTSKAKAAKRKFTKALTTAQLNDDVHKSLCVLMQKNTSTEDVSSEYIEHYDKLQGQTTDANNHIMSKDLTRTHSFAILIHDKPTSFQWLTYPKAQVCWISNARTCASTVRHAYCQQQLRPVENAVRIL